MLREASIDSGKGVIHYSYTDTGKAAKLLVLHGYGQEGKKMRAIAELAKHHDVFLVDLPGHGKTETRDITPRIWCEALSKVTGNRISIFAYSLGGSVALSMLESWPEKIEQLILAAPSGIGNDSMYDFSVHTAIGKKLFAAFVKYPWFVLGPIRIAKSLKLIPASLGVFLLSKIDTREKRERLFDRWMQCRYLRVSQRKAIRTLDRQRMKLTLIAGKDDTVVTPGQVKRFVSKVERAHYFEMNAGHRLYEAEVMEEICEKLLL